MLASLGQNLPMDIQAQFGKVTTDRQHEKRIEFFAFCGQMIQTSLSSFMKSRLKHVLFGVFVENQKREFMAHHFPMHSSI